MVVERTPWELEGASIRSRRFEEGILTLVPSQGEEVNPVCTCGRSHWLVTVQGGRKGYVLSLVCHGCGRRCDLPYGGPVPGRG